MVLEDADAQPKQSYVMQTLSMSNEWSISCLHCPRRMLCQPRDCFIWQEWQCSYSIFFTDFHVYFI